MAKTKPELSSLKPATQLALAGREYSVHGFVNPGVYHVSTVAFPTVQALHDRKQEYLYGRRGTPTSRALESAISLLEGGAGTRLCASGLAACGTALLSFLKAGDHLLMVDSVYQPVRLFCDRMLSGLGIEVEYYDPLVGGGIAALIRPETRLIYCESPGSQTMEIQDIPAICAAALKRGIPVAADNTWGAGHFYKPLALGCGISIQAVTKYIAGHSDTMLGCITADAARWPRLDEMHGVMGQFAGPDDMNLALRGLRSMEVRLARHQRNALTVAEFLRARPEVLRVLYPALEGDPGHAIWKRDYTGASGLFSVVLKPVAAERVAAMLDGLTLFRMGDSWGGFESLAVPFKPARTAIAWTEPGPCIRFHIGLEEPADLIADLEAGFARLGKA
jgi:cysteine-S-conjugate beta-lyase